MIENGNDPAALIYQSLLVGTLSAGTEPVRLMGEWD